MIQLRSKLVYRHLLGQTHLKVWVYWPKKNLAIQSFAYIMAASSSRIKIVLLFNNWNMRKMNKKVLFSNIHKRGLLVTSWLLNCHKGRTEGNILVNLLTKIFCALHSSEENSVYSDANVVGLETVFKQKIIKKTLMVTAWEGSSL